MGFVQLIALAWQNGGSVAREVMAAGGSGLQGSTGGSTSRASKHLGPLSALAGVEGSITVVEGEGSGLVIDGLEYVLGSHEPLGSTGRVRPRAVHTAHQSATSTT